MKKSHQQLFQGWKRRPPFVERSQGFTLIEVVIAGAVAVVLGVSVIESLLVLEKHAEVARLYTNARIIVQRNIDAANSVDFTGTTGGVVPDILAITSNSGTICNDAFSSQNESISALLSGTLDGSLVSGTLVSGTLVSVNLISGTLTRTVIAMPSSTGTTPTSTSGSMDIRQVTFRLDYVYRNEPYSYSETTLRAADLQ